MNARLDVSAVQIFDQPLDLPPPAIMDDIAQVAAAARARCRLVGRELAEAVDKLGRVMHRGGIGDVDMGTQNEQPRFRALVG